MEKPLVSVVIPAYNAEKYIEKCLSSLVKQTYQNFEVIMIDDGSIDDTLKIARKFSRRFNLEITKNEENLGEGASRNRGVQLAQGEIIAHTDSDVVLPSAWLENIVRNMNDYGVKCVAGGYIRAIGNSFIQKFPHLELLWRRRQMPKFVQTAVANNFATEREVFLEVGGFPEKYKCEDMILSYKISRRHRIYWDKNNGVYHHFRNSLKAYLRQQYYFARDTIITYYRYPEVLRVKTHQGRQVPMEVALIYISILMLIFGSNYFFWPLLIIVALNVPFLLFLYENGISWLKSLGVIILRDTVAAVGVVVGGIIVLLDWLKIRKI